MAFLKQQETIYKELEQLREEEPNKSSWRDPKIAERRSARTKSTKSIDDQGRVVCGDVKHKRNLYFCKQFKALTAAERKASVKKLGACTRCLEVHDDQTSCKPGFYAKTKTAEMNRLLNIITTSVPNLSQGSLVTNLKMIKAKRSTQRFKRSF